MLAFLVSRQNVSLNLYMLRNNNTEALSTVRKRNLKVRPYFYG